MRRLVALSFALFALAAVTVTASAGASSCSSATARSAIRATQPHIRSLANASLLVTPSMADIVVCIDFSRDGRTDMGVTVASGGSAGDIGWLAFLRTGAGWRLVHGQSGYKIGLFTIAGDLVDSEPIYKKNDSNCCPTGGFDHERWHWNGQKLVRIRSYHTKTYRP